MKLTLQAPKTVAIVFAFVIVAAFAVCHPRAGKTEIWGVIYRPTNFDPLKKYPVIENIYSI